MLESIIDLLHNLIESNAFFHISLVYMMEDSNFEWKVSQILPKKIECRCKTRISLVGNPSFVFCGFCTNCVFKFIDSICVKIFSRSTRWFQIFDATVDLEVSYTPSYH